MTWSDFKQAVSDLITVDAERIGSEAYIERMIRLAVGEVQRLVPRYRKGHELTYAVGDVALDGEASIITLPDGQLTITEAYRLSEDDSCDRKPFKTYPFTNRNDLICGRVDTDLFPDLLSQNREATKLWIYPKLETGFEVQIVGEGIRMEFEDEDVVPFDERVAVVVAEFVKSKLAREVERDVRLAADYERTYKMGLNSLFTSARDSVDLDVVQSRATSLCSTSESSEATASAGSNLPTGAIIMWYGSAETVPTGWKICDGTSGTPDMRAKSVMGKNPATGTPSSSTLITVDASGNYSPQVIGFLNVHFIIKT